MDKVYLGLGSSIAFILMLAALLPLTTLFGAISGWIVGWFFGDTILYVLAQVGIRGVTMWQLGAALGFLSGFLKTKVSS